MGSKAWIVILAIGVGGVVILGLMVQYAIDSSPALRLMIQFKGALAQDFGDRGFEDVSLRSMRSRRGFHLTLTLPSALDVGEVSRLDTEISRYFVKNFKGRQGDLLSISYRTPGSFACSGPELFHETEIPLHPLQEKVEEEGRVERLAAALHQRAGASVVSHRREPRTLLLDVEIPAEYPGDLVELARSTSELTRVEFRPKPYMFLELRFFWATLPGPGKPREAVAPAAKPLASSQEKSTAAFAPILEVRFDYRGRRLDA